ncbi:MAG: c-type cytochrome biogenesis protein CcsB [Candidatus Nanopelagicales bacterium]|nr:c-type cytochrome biogenesis protein CcsB [Candidatus Nanopelagicales bacterium]
MSSETWAYTSNALVYSTIIVLSFALLAFAADLAVGTGQKRADAAKPRRSSLGRQATSGSGGNAGGATVTVAAPPLPDVQRWARVGVSLTTLAAALAVGAVITRGISVERPPWGNMYEFTVTAVATMLVIWVAMLPTRPEWRDLGILVVLFNLLLLGVAVLVLYTEAAQLVPALKSYWLWIHVTAAIIASSVFTVGSLASVLYLFSERSERRAAAGSAGDVRDWIGARLPASDQLDKVAYQTISFAFPLWFFAVVAGAVWAEDAWGRYWGWDPKEVWAFVTLVIYAAYLHARATAGWRGRPAAIIAIVGLTAFLFSYFGVNIFFVGLHSYGGT